MAKYPGLMLRDGRWTLRVVVPENLREVVGRREIWRTLGTSDRRKAVGLYLDERAEVERMFARAREGVAALDEDETIRLAVDWFRRTDHQVAGADFNLHGDALQDALEGAEYDEAVLVRGGEDIMPSVCATVDSILISQGHPARSHQIGGIKTSALVAVVDRTSGQYAALRSHVHRALIELSRRRLSRLNGERSGATFDPMFDAHVTPGSLHSPRSDNAPHLTEILDRWLAERKPPERTESEWRAATRRFCEVCGDLPVDAITKAHVRDFKDALLKLPAAIRRGLRGKTVPQIIAATRDRRLATVSAVTVNKQLAALRSLLSWSVRNGHIENNVAAGFSVATAKNAGPKRLPYSTDDLKIIVGSLGQFREREPSKLWIPLLALHTGARLSELGQLTVDDVRHENGVDFIDINTEGKSAKTRSSIRRVPLHPALVRCGFLAYVSRQRARDGRLFPELTPDAFSKWWRRHMRMLGITDRRKVFHSFRHGFKDACLAARIPEQTQDSLMGHSGGGVGRTYGGGVPLDVLAEAVVKIDYGLDLDHLHQR